MKTKGSIGKGFNNYTGRKSWLGNARERLQSALEVPQGPQASYFCKVYLCENKSANKTGYCADHCSDLRSGCDPMTPGCPPVIHTTFGPGEMPELMKPNWASQGFRRRRSPNAKH